MALELGGGESRTGVSATLIGGAGSIQGTVRNSNGAPIGGATITVLGPRQQLQTATRFVTPEPEVNDAIRQSVRFSLNLSEKNPATGKYCKLTGAWVYADLWATASALDVGMLLDTHGYHADVSRYLEIFRDEQGTVAPPGDGYELHPGYLCTPKLYKSIDWLSDNGAVLWTIARHALLSGDTAFTECIVKSCDWIKVNRARTNHAGYKGVLPPAVATDAQTKIQAVWSIGWNYVGLCAAVQVLERLKAAGLGSLPGGGAEILVDRVRAAITRGKVMSDDWLDVCRILLYALWARLAWQCAHNVGAKFWSPVSRCALSAGLVLMVLL